MKKIIIAIILCVVFSSPCYAYRFADKWNKKDTAYQGVFLAITAVDWAQTHWMAKHNWAWDGKQHYEVCPFLSRYPTVREVDTLLPLGMITHTIIALALPPEATVLRYKINPRRIWQCIFIGIEAGAVVNNYSLGVRIEF
jgi:hypothetical protein